MGDLKKRLTEGKDINFAEPMLVTNATALFEGDSWNELRRHWSAARISSDEPIEKKLRLEYWPPDKARARLIGNQLQMEEPEMVAFSLTSSFASMDRLRSRNYLGRTLTIASKL